MRALCSGVHRAKTVVRSAASASSRSVESVHAVGREYAARGHGDPQIAAGAYRRARVVAGEDLDGDAPAGEFRQGAGGGGHEGVAEGDEAAEGQAAFVGGEGGSGRCGAGTFGGGDGEQPKAASALRARRGRAGSSRSVVRRGRSAPGRSRRRP